MKLRRNIKWFIKIAVFAFIILGAIYITVRQAYHDETQEYNKNVQMRQSINKVAPNNLEQNLNIEAKIKVSTNLLILYHLKLILIYFMYKLTLDLNIKQDDRLYIYI